VFTGLVDDVGVVSEVATTGAGLELRIRSRYEQLKAGESVAVNGACLTVREHGPGWFTVAAVVTTVERTTIGDWSPGRRVNLERALALGDRLGGHIVQGHVDGVGMVMKLTRSGDATLIDFSLPAGVAELAVPQGSITLDGVSLTIAALPAAELARVSLIDYTLRHTALGDLAPGSRVHVEGDVIGKFVRRLVAPHLAARDAGNSAAS
jgi:riboflavin synthase